MLNFTMQWLQDKTAGNSLLRKTEDVVPGVRSCEQLCVRVTISHHLLKGWNEVAQPNILKPVQVASMTCI